MNGPGRIELAVVSAGEGSGEAAGRWRRRLEEHLSRTGNLADAPLRADALVVVVDEGFPAAMRRALREPDGCFDAIREALAAGKALLPVTVGHASIPEPADLPEAVRDLARFQGLALDRESDVPGVAARLVVASRTASLPPVPPRSDAGSVFISYRREDAWYWASLLARAVARRVGARNVFFDLGSIAPGRRFDDEIRARILGATDFVVLVGPAFLAPGPDGRRRIDRREDFLRREIATALEARRRIHVVLAGDAAMPDPGGLPGEIAGAFGGAVPLPLTDYRAADGVAGAILAGGAAGGGRPTSGAGRPGTTSPGPLAPGPLASSPPMSGPRPPLRPGGIFARSRPPGSPGLPRRHGPPGPPGRPALPGLPGLPGSRHPHRPTPQEEAERLVMTAVPPLAALGWRPVDPDRTGGALLMTRTGDGAYRFAFDFENSALVLLEHGRSAAALGVKRWIRRAMFPVTADAPDLDVLRPPDRQVEAMENPAAYLDRTGRVDLDLAPKPPMDMGSFDRALGAFAQPARRALDEQARERARIRARGGLRVLRRVRRVSPGEDVLARAVAADPATGRFAAATDHGVRIMDPAGESAEPAGLAGDLTLVAFSRDGMLAATDDQHRLSVLDAAGTAVVRRRSPYPVWRRLTGVRGPFRTLSWSGDGSRVALGASDRIWLYYLHGDEFEEVALEIDGQGFSAAALFAPGSDDLWIMHFSTIRRASRSTGAIHGRLDLAAGSEVHDAEPGSRSIMEPTVGLKPTCLAVSPDGERLAVGGNDAQLLLVDAGRLEPTALRVWHAPMVRGRFNGEVEALAFGPAGRRLASVANDDRLVVGDVAGGGSVADAILARDADGRPVPLKRDVCWSADGRRIVTVGGDGAIDIWEAPEVE